MKKKLTEKQAWKIEAARWDRAKAVAGEFCPRADCGRGRNCICHDLYCRMRKAFGLRLVRIMEKKCALAAYPRAFLYSANKAGAKQRAAFCRAQARACK